MKRNYIVLRYDRRMDGTIYEAYADDMDGFDAFVAAARDILPGSTVDVGELNTVLRLRCDGSWETYREYVRSAAEERQAIVDDVLSALPDGDEEEF